MTAGPLYVLDANVLIEAFQRYYAFDLVPEFWDGLVWHSQAGRICSIDRIQDELERGKDELAKWADGSFGHAFASTRDKDVIEAYRRVIQWSESQARFTRSAKSQFAQTADAWLVAYALAKGCTLVTHETPAPNGRNQVKIPDVCIAFGVVFQNTFAMLRDLGGLGRQCSVAHDAG